MLADGLGDAVKLMKGAVKLTEWSTFLHADRICGTAPSPFWLIVPNSTLTVSQHLPPPLLLYCPRSLYVGNALVWGVDAITLSQRD
jgi:hypothetical protein